MQIHEENLTFLGSYKWCFSNLRKNCLKFILITQSLVILYHEGRTKHRESKKMKGSTQT